MKDPKKLIEVINTYAVEPYKQAMLGEIRPSIRLKTTGNSCEELGRTKLGGCPDLPQKVTWPTSNFDNSYLSFLGQVNLEEVARFDQEKLLPKAGILYFFFNLDSADDGRVIFLDKVPDLKRAHPPEEFKEPKKSFLQTLFTGKSKKKILKENQVEIHKEYSIPSWDSLHMDKNSKDYKDEY